MVPPPKKDAFADLFQMASASTSTKSNGMSMSERQKHLQNPQSLRQQQQSSGSGLLSTWSNIDILSGNSSRTSSPAQINPNNFNTYSVLTPSQNSHPASGVSSTASLSQNNVVNDPFDIFGESAVPSSKPVGSHSNGSSNRSNEISLLEGDFEDAFVKKQPLVEPQPQHTVAQPNLSARQDSTPSPVSASRQPTLADSRQQSPVDRADSVLAELVDIGFQMDDATEALAKQGADLQLCVNYIISKNSAANSRGSTPRNSGNRNVASKGLEEISSDFFRSAGYLFNKSRQTVLKNLEQLNLSGSNSSSPGVPEWMKNQQKYKDEAIEKKFGNGELDYGSDSENINYDKIETFMKFQKEKDRDRVKERFENIKTKALNKSSSAPSRTSDDLNGHYGFDDDPRRPTSTTKTSEFQQKQKHLPRGSLGSSSSFQTVSDPNLLNTIDVGVVPRRAPKASVELPVPQKSQKTRPRSEEVDLLGLSGSGENKAVSSLRSSVPLNQFESVDYITSKTTAQNAFKSGDYGTALDSYLVCMHKLPPKHELRVIILSNLGVVYKLVGQLRQSLESIESALELISIEEEVQNVAFVIDSKPVKYWYTKLIITKAEVLELMEKYELSLQHYQILIKDLGVLDKKIMDGKRRVDKIVNPNNHKIKMTTPSSTPKPGPVPVSSRPSSVNPVVAKPEATDVDPLVKDKIAIMIQNWAQSRNNQLRGLLTNLGEIIPSNISMKPALRTLTTNELMLPKQVKTQYLKVISSIHPDKLASQCRDNKQSELVCNGVFIILNRAWDSFKEENKM